MPTATRPQWAARICASTRKTIESMIATGKLLVAAKEQLKHGEFLEMIRKDLPFKARTAQRLMKIATSTALANASIRTLLPPHLGTLHDLAGLPPEDFERAVERGAINPAMTKADVQIIATPMPPVSGPTIHITAAPADAEEPQPQLGVDEMIAAMCRQAYLTIRDAVGAIARSRLRDRFTVDDLVAESKNACEAEQKEFTVRLNTTINFLTQLRDERHESTQAQQAQAQHAVVVSMKEWRA